MTEIKHILKQADDNLEESIERLLKLMRIQSISTDSKFAEQCTQAAEFLVAELKELGFEIGKEIEIKQQKNKLTITLTDKKEEK